jgi:GTP-binding protein
MDVRRGVTELDRALLRWIRPDVPVLVILTKSDKLGRAQQRQALDTVEAALREARLPNPVSLLAFSSTTGLGLEQARGWLEAVLGEAIEAIEARDHADAQQGEDTQQGTPRNPTP